MQIDFGNLELVRLVIERQANDHLPAMKNHLTTWATLESGDLGLILQALKPANDAIVEVGEQVLDKTQEVYAQGADNLKGVINAYADAEQRAHEILQTFASSMGLTLPAYENPLGNLPSLGSAKDDSGPYYRAGDPNLFQQAYEDGYRAGDAIQEEIEERIPERLGEMIGSSAAVAEEQDVQSYLVTPTGAFSEIEDLRWSAGIILGSLDWVFEKLFGFSFLNEIVFKPFAGDWNRIQMASGAWTVAGDAMRAVSRNTTGVLPGLAEWTGKGSEGFTVAAAAVAAVVNAIAGVAKTIAAVLKAFAFLVKEVAAQIGQELREASYHLASIAAEAAIPVVGWGAAVLKMAERVSKIYDAFRKAYKYVNMIYDFLSNIVEAQASIVDTYRQISQVVEALVRGAVARV